MSLLDFNTFKPNYIGRPTEAIGNYLNAANQQRNRIVDDSSALDIAMSNVDVDPRDQGAQILKQQQLEKFRQGVDDIISSDNYSLAGAKIKRISRDFVTNKGLQQAVTNKQAYDTEVNRQKARHEAGKLSDAAYNRFLSDPSPQTVQEADGFYSKYTPKEYVDLYDFDTQLSDFGSRFRETVTRTSPQFRRNSDGSLEIDPNTGQPTGTEQIEEQVKNPDRLAEGLRKEILNSPEALSSATQEASLQGKTLDEFINDLIDPILARETGITTRSLGTLYKPTVNKRTISQGEQAAAGLDSILGTTSASNTLQLQGRESRLAKRLSGTSDILEGTIAGKTIKNVGNSFVSLFNTLGRIATGNDIIDNKKFDNDGFYKPQDDDLEIVNDILVAVGSNKSYYNLSKEEKTTFIPKVVAYMDEHYTNEELSPVGRNIPSGVSKEFQTRYLNTDDKGRLKRAKSGNFIYAGAFGELKVWHPDYGEMSGDQLMTKLSHGDIEGIGKKDEVKIALTRAHNYKNPATYFTGEDSFSKASEIDINGVSFFITNPAQPKGRDKVLSQMFKLKRKPNQPIEIRELGLKVYYDAATKQFTSDSEDGNKIVAPTEDQLFDKLINNLKSNNQ